jgi:predicted flap endonuclease-1-like 5' DNA nuclease
MKALLSAMVILAFGASSAAACGWMKKNDAVADLGADKTKPMMSVMSGTADDARAAEAERPDTTERPQIADKPAGQDTDAN